MDKLEFTRDSGQAGGHPETGHRAYVASSLVTLTLSFAVYEVLGFLIRIVLAGGLPTDEYGLVTYCWSTGSTLGFLLMVGREHEALVNIPRMGHSDLRRLHRYLRRVSGFIVAALFILLTISTIAGLQLEVLGIAGFVLGNLAFQMVQYTLLGNRRFGTHLLVNASLNGASLACVYALKVQGMLNARTALSTLILVLAAAVFIGATLVGLNRHHETPAVETPDSPDPSTTRTWVLTRFEVNNLRFFVIDLAGTMIPLIPILSLQGLRGYEQVAYFSLASTFYKASLVFASVLHSTYAPILSQSFLSDKARYFRLLKESLGLTILVQGLLAIALGVFSQSVLSFFVDARYATSSTLLQLMLLGTAFESLYFVCSSVLRTSAHSRELLAVNLAALGTCVGLVPAFVFWFGAVGAAGSYALVLLLQGSTGFLAMRYVFRSLQPDVLTSRYTLAVLLWCACPPLELALLLISGTAMLPLYQIAAASVFILLGFALDVASPTSLKPVLIRKA